MSVVHIGKANFEELLETDSIDKKAAQSIIEYFSGKDKL